MHRGYATVMRIGASLFLIALGAILEFAVNKHVNGININTVGLILMVVGIIGLLIDLLLWSNRRRTTVVTRQPGVTYVQPTDPIDRI
jgi:hypothetical protein